MASPGDGEKDWAEKGLREIEVFLWWTISMAREMFYILTIGSGSCTVHICQNT